MSSKSNMHQLSTGLPDVFMVLRLDVQIPGGCKIHILRLDHSREAGPWKLFLKLRPRVSGSFCPKKKFCPVSNFSIYRFWLVSPLISQPPQICNVIKLDRLYYSVPIFCGKWYRGEGKTFKINNVEMQDRHSCKRRLGCLFCLCRRRIWQGGADVSEETKEMIKI